MWNQASVVTPEDSKNSKFSRNKQPPKPATIRWLRNRRCGLRLWWKIWGWGFIWRNPQADNRNVGQPCKHCHCHSAKRAKSSYRKSELLAVSRPVCGQNTAVVFSDGDECYLLTAIERAKYRLGALRVSKVPEIFCERCRPRLGRNISYEVKKMRIE